MTKISQKKYARMRQQARQIVANVGVSLFLRAQDHTCPVCGESLTSKEVTIDHVWPINQSGINYGNIFLCHFACNQEKGDRLPTATEIAWLDKVNTRLRYDADKQVYMCRQGVIARYHKTALWLNELKSRQASEHDINKVLTKMAGMERFLGEFA